MTDFIGRKNTWLAGSYIGFILYFFIYISINYKLSIYFIVIPFVLTSIFGTFTFPATSSYIADITPEGDRVTAYSLWRIMSNMGWAIGPIIGSIIFVIGVKWIFLFLTVTILIQTAVVYFYITERKIIEKGYLHLKEVIFSKNMISYDKNLVIFSAGTLFLMILVSQFSVTLPVFAVKVGSVLPSQIGFIFAVNGLIVVIGQYPVSVLMRSYHDIYAIMIGSLFYIVGYLLVSILHGITFFMLDMVVITIGENFTSPYITSLISKISPRDKIGRYMGFNGMANSVARSMGPAIGTTMMFFYLYNPVEMWLLIDLFGITGLMIFVLSIKRLKNYH